MTTSPGNRVSVERTINTEKYKAMSEHDLIKELEKIRAVDKPINQQQLHVTYSKLVKYFQDKRVEQLDWSKNSLDFHPSEKL